MMRPDPISQGQRRHPGSAKGQRQRRFRRLLLEPLEDRRLLAVRVWDGGGGPDTNWSTAANWSDDTVPGVGDVAQFDGTYVGNSTIDAGYAGSLDGIDIQSGYTGTVTQSTALTVGASHFGQAGGIFSAGAALVLNGDFSLSGGSFIAPGSSHSFAVAGDFAVTGGTFAHNSGTVTFDAGSGTQTLNSGGATFHAVTHSGVGTLQLVTSSLTTAGTFTNSAGIFDINGLSPNLNKLTLTGGNIADTNGTPGQITSSNAYDLQNGTVSAKLVGGVGLTKTTSGTVTLSGANSYTGNTTVSAGTLVVTGVIGSGGGTAVTTTGTAALVVNSTNGLTGTSSLTVGTGTTATLSTANNFSGATNLTGTLQLENAGALGSSALTIHGGATVRLRSDVDTVFAPAGITATLNGTAMTIDVDNAGSAVTGKTLTLGAITFNQNNVAKTINVTGGNGYSLALGAIKDAAGSANSNPNITINATTAPVTVASYTASNWSTTLVLQGGNNITFTGSISSSSNGNFNTRITGAGTVATLNAATIKTGSAVLNQILDSGATLNVNHASALNPSGGTFTINGGTIDNTSGAAITVATNPAQAWNGDFVFTGTNSLSLGTGAVTLGGNRQVTINSNNLTVGGVISGAFNLTKAGSGTLTLSGANTFGGAGRSFTLDGGQVNINAAAALGNVATTFIINGGTLDNTTAGAITTSNYPQMWNADFTFTGTRSLNLGTGAVTMGASRQVTVNGTGTLTVGGAISGATYGITKAGNGTLSLGGVIGTTTGGLAVNSGTLIVGNSANTFTGNVTIDGDSSVLQMTSGSNGNATSAPLGIFPGGTGYKTVTLTNGGVFRPMASYNDNVPSAGTPGAGYVFSIGTGGGGFDVPSGVTLTIDDGSGAGTATTNAQLQGVGTLTKTGTGTLSLGNGSSNFTAFTGAILVNAGTLTTGTASTNPFGDTTAGTIIASGAVLNLKGVTFTTLEPLIVSGTGVSNGGAIINSSTTAATFAGPVTLDAATSIGGANSFTLSGALSGSFDLTKVGAGTVTLSGTNTSYANVVTVSAGTLRLASTSALGTTAGNTIVSSGAVLDLNAQNYATAEPLTVSGTGISNAGAIINSNSTAATFAGPVTLDAATSIGGANSFTLSGAISGGFDLTKVGAGTVTFGVANTYTGKTVINAGKLSIAAEDRLGPNPSGGFTADQVTLNGGTLEATTSFAMDDANRGVTVGAAGGTFDVNSGQTLTVYSPITGPGNLAKTDTGTLVLINDSNDYAGNTNVNAGTLVASVPNALGGSTRGTNVASGATLRYDATGGAFSAAAEPLRLNGAGVSSAGALQTLGDDVTLAGPIYLAGDTTIASSTAGKTLTLNGAVSKEAPATLTLTGAGNFDVVAGIPDPAPGYTLSAITARAFNGVQQAIDIASVITDDINGTTTPTRTATLNGPLTFANADAFNALFIPSIPLGNNFTTVFETTLTVMVPGEYSFAATNNDDGAAVWLKPAANASFAAGDKLQGIVANNNSVLATTTLAAGDYTLVYAHREGSGGEAVTGRMKGPGYSAVADGTQLPIVNPAWAAVASNHLVKTGTGTVTLRGDNTYSGTTTVSGGTLTLVSTASNNSINASPIIDVQTGATLDVTGLDNGTANDTLILAAGQTLKGNGTVSGSVSAVNTSRLSPGASPGTLTILNDLSAETGTSVDVEIVGGFTGAPVAGTNYDQFVVSGNVELDATNSGGATLNLTVSGGTVPSGSSFTIIQNDGIQAIGHTFYGFPEGSPITVGSNTFTITYVGGDGNDVVLLENSGTPGLVYVDDGSNFGLGHAPAANEYIPDADAGTAGFQAAIYGYNAFSTLAEAITAVTATGQVIVNDGTYAETVKLDGTKTLTVTSAAAVAIGALATEATTTVQINGTTLAVGDGSDFEMAGLITGTGGLTKAGIGTLTLSYANSYAGPSAVDAGTLKLKAPTYTPSGMLLWLDASDGTTVTESGGLVTQWRDKSGNGYLANASGAQSPTWTPNALLGGRNVMRFDGSSDYVQVSSLPGMVGTSYTILAVEGRLSNKSNNYFLGGGPTATTNQMLHFGYRADTTFTLAQYGNDLNGTVAGYAGQQFAQFTGQLDTASGHYLFRNGSLLSSNANTTPFAAFTYFNVGMANNGFFNGDVAEVLVYNSALSTADRQAVERYLQAKWSGILPSSTTVSVAPGATLDLNGVNQTVGSLADGTGGGGTVTNSGAADAGLTVGDATATVFSGTLSDGSTNKLSLTKTGSGALMLAGTNTHSGGTTLSTGTIQIAADSTGAVGSIVSGPLGTGVLTFNGGTLSSDSTTARTILNAVTFTGAAGLGDATNSGKLTFSANANLGTAVRTLTVNSAVEFSGVLSNTGGITKAGSDTLTLSGGNMYTGATAINAGILQLGNASALPTTTTVTVGSASGGTLDLNGYDATITNLGAGNAAGTITDNSAGSGTSTLNITAFTNALATLVADGPMQKVAIAIANGNNAPTLANSNNTFSGGLLLKHGTGNGTRLTVSSAPVNTGVPGTIVSSPFGRGTITIGQLATDKAGIYITAANTTILNDIVFNTALGTDRVGMRYDATGGVLGGRLTANVAATFSTNGTGSVTITGQITGTQGLTLDNTYGTKITVTLNNTTASPNDYQGATNIAGTRGVLVLDAANQIPNGSAAGNVTNGGTLNLNGFSETINGLSGSGTVDGVSGTPTLTIGDNDQTSTFSGVIKNTAGTLAVTKIGTGTLTLSGTGSTFSGNVDLQGGIIALTTGHNDTNNTSAIGLPVAAGRTITVNSGTTLRFSNNDILGNAGASPTAKIVVNGGTVTNTGNFFNTLGPIDLNAGTLTAVGGASASYQAWRLFGTITVGGSAPSTISAGGSNAGVHLHSSTTIVVADATGDTTPDLIVSTALINQAGTLSAGALTKSGGGTMTLSGANTYSGSTTVNGGVISASSLAANGTASNIGQGTSVVLAGGTLRYTGGNFGSDAGAKFNRNIIVNAPGGTLDTTTGFVLFNGVLTGSGALNVIDSGGDSVNNQWLFTNNSPAFDGDISIGTGAANSGWLQLRSNSANMLGSTVGKTTINAGGVLSADNGGAAVDVSIAENIDLNGGRLAVQSATLTLTGALHVAAGSMIGHINSQNNGILNINGPFTGSADVSFNGSTGNPRSDSGYIRIGGTSANTFSGTINLIRERLELSKPAGVDAFATSSVVIGSDSVAGSRGVLMLQASDQIPDTTAISFSNQTSNFGFFDLNGFDENIGGLIDTTTRAIVQATEGASSKTSILTISNSVANHFASGIRNSASGSDNSLTLVKNNIGALTLTGVNIYTGPTTVNGGTLLVSGSITSNTTVNSPGVLGGTGKITGNVLGTGTVSPGASIESLEITGDYTPSGPTLIEIQAPYGTGDFDQLIVGGTVNLGGGTLTLSATGAAPPAGNQMKIIDNTGSGSVTPFSNYADGAAVSHGNYSGYISYFGGDGNDVVLTTAYSGPALVTGTGGGDAFEVRRVGNTIQVLRAGAGVVFSAPLAALTSLQIDGGDGDDNLVVNYADDATTDGYFDLDILFNGGDHSTPLPGDTLTIVGPGGDKLFDSVTFNHTGVDNGDVTVVEGGVTSVISYTGLEPVIVDGSAAAVVINLPATDNNTTLSVSGGNLLIASSPVSHESDSIGLAGLTSITVYAGDGNDTITLDSSLAGFAGAITIDGGDGSDTINLNAALNLSVGGGTLAATAEAIAIGAVTIQTSGNQTYTGPLTLSGSTLNPGAASVILGGDVTINGTAASAIQGQLDLGAATRTFTVGDVAVGTDLSIPAVVSNGGLTKAGAGTMVLSGPNTYNGVTTIDAGVLSIPSIAASGSNSPLGTGHVTFGGGTLRYTGATASTNRNITLGAGGGTLEVDDDSAGPTSVMTWTGNVTGAHSLTKTGPDTLVLSGTGVTFTGNVGVPAGVLSFQDASAFSTGGASAITQTLSTATGAVLEFNVTAGTQSLGRVGSTVISGTGTLRKAGGGTLALDNTSATDNNVTLAMTGGLIDIQGGKIQNGGWAGQNWTNNKAGLNITGGATFDVWDGSQIYVDALTGAGSVVKNQGGGGQTLRIGVNGGSGTFSGLISNTLGTTNLIKEGAGTQIFSGPNIYSGGTTINAGTIQLSGADNRLPISGGVTIANATGATLDLNGLNQEIRWLAGGGGNGGSVVNAGTAATLTINLGASGTKTYDGTITGNIGVVVKNSTTKNTDFQAFTRTNSYNGKTVIDNGHLRITGDGMLGAVPGSLDATNITLQNGGVLQNNNSTLTVGAARGITLGTGGGVIYAGWTQTLTINGPIAGIGSLTKTDGAMLELTNASSSYSGGTIILQGLLKASDNTLGASSGPVTLNGGTLFNVSASGGGAYFDADLGRPVILETVGGGIRSGWGNTTVSGKITSTGTGNLIIVNDGAVILTNSTNDYAGNTVLGAAGSGNNATLRLGAADVIPHGAGKGNVVFNASASGTATFDLNGFSETINGLTSGGSGANVVDNTSGTGTYTLTVGDNDQTSTYGGVIRNASGTLALVKTGGGTLTLNGDNTYSGGTLVSSGTLALGGNNNGSSRVGLGTLTVSSGATAQITAANALGWDSPTNSSPSIVIDGGLVDFLGNTASFRTLTMNGGTMTRSGGFWYFNQPGSISATGGTPVISGGTMNLRPAGGALMPIDVANGVRLTISSILGNDSGASGFAKSGPGTLTLSAENSYTGATSVNAGTLLVNGSTSAGSAVTVNNNAVLGGTGTIGGAVTVNNTATIGAGSPSGGTESLATGALTLGGMTTFDVTIHGTTQGDSGGSGYDVVNVTGGATLNNATLNVAGGYSPVLNDSFTILTATNPVTGNFKRPGSGATINDGDTILLNGQPLEVKYNQGGNNVKLNFDTSVVINADVDTAVPGTVDNTILVKRNGANLEVFIDNMSTPVFSTPYASVSTLVINGQTGNDTLTVDYSNNTAASPVPAGGLVFNGDGQTVGDTLYVSQGGFATLVYDAKTAGGGRVTLNGTDIIDFTGLEPVIFTSSTSATDVTINIDPDNNFTAATIGSTFTSAGAGQTTVSFTGPAFESLTFPNPSQTLTVNGGTDDADTITFTSLGSGFTAAIAIPDSGGTDTINLNTALNLTGGGGSLNVAAESIAVGAVTIQTNGNQTYTGPLTLSGSTLNPSTASVVLGGDVTVSGAAASTIQGKLDLGGVTRTLTVGDVAVGTDLSISAIVSNGGLTKAGAGTMVLSGPNTYSGVTTIGGGVLSVSSLANGGLASNIGQASNNHANLVLSGGTLAYTGATVTIDRGITVTTGSGGTIDVPVGVNLTTTGTVRSSASSAAVLTKTGLGTLTLGGAAGNADNFYLAATVNAGTLVLAKQSSGSVHAVGAGLIVNSNATVQLAGTGGDQLVGAVTVNSGGTFDMNGRDESTNITLSGTGVGGLGALINNGAGPSTLTGTVANGTYSVGGTADLTINGQIGTSGTSTLTKSDANKLTLTGTTDNIGLAVVANAGTVVLAKTSSGSVHAVGGSGTVLTVNNGATVQLAGSGGDQISTQGDVVVNTGGTLDLNGQSEGFDGLNGGGTIDNTAAGAVTLTVGEANAGGTFSGVIQDTGALSLTRTGTGALYLDGNNSYDGLTTVTGNGYLVARHSNALGTIASGTVVNSGSTLQLEHATGIAIPAEPLTISGTGVGGTRGALASWSGTNSYGGPVTLAADSSVFVNGGLLTILGIIGETGSARALTKIGAGTLTLTGTNTYTGLTTVLGGPVYGSGTGASLVLANSSGAAIQGNLQLGNGTALGSPSVLRTDATNQFGPNTVVTFAAAGFPAQAVFKLNGNSQTVAGISSSSANTQNVIENTEAESSVGPATLTIDANAPYTYSGTIRRAWNGTSVGALHVTKTGSGTQTFAGSVIFTQGQSAAQSYNGDVLVGAGTLKLQDTTSYTGGNTLTVNATLEMNVTGTNTVQFRSMTLAGSGTVSKTGTGNVLFGANGQNANVSLSAGALIDVQAGVLRNEYGAGVWTSNLGSLNVGASGTFYVWDANTIVDSLTGSGTIEKGQNNTHTLTLGAANNVGPLGSDFSGAIKNTTGTINLTKTGTGIQTLSGANTYSGTTNVNAGTLLVNGTNSGTGTVNVNNSAVLGGTGTIAGSVTVQSGGTLSPGLSPGNPSVGSLTQNPNSTYLAELGGTSPGIGAGFYDQTIVNGVTGTITLGATNGAGAPGTTYNPRLDVRTFEVTSGGSQFVPDKTTLQTFEIIKNAAGTIQPVQPTAGSAAAGTVNGALFLDANNSDAALLEGSPVIVLNSLTSLPLTDPLYISYRGGSSGHSIVLNSQPVISGTAGDDVLVLRRKDASNLEFSLNGAALVTVSDAVPFTFNGLAGNDVMIVDLRNGNVDTGTGNITFNGGGNASDVLVIQGTGTETADYTPSTTAGQGSVVTTVGITPATVNFTGATAVDAAALATVRLAPGNVTNVVGLANGANYAGYTAIGGVPYYGATSVNALVFSGTTGGTAFAPLAAWSNTTVAYAGNATGDAVTVSNASLGNNTNLSLNSGSGGTNSVTVAGGANVSLGGSLAITSAAINLNTATAIQTVMTQTYTGPVSLGADTTISSTGSGADGLISFGSTIDGGHSLTVNSPGDEVFHGMVGGTTALTSLTADATGTVGGQTQFNMTAPETGTAGGVNAGSVTVNDAVAFNVSSSTAANPSVRTSGSQTYNGAATLARATFLTATAGGNVTFATGGTIDGAPSLTVNAGGSVDFNGLIGSVSPPSSLTVAASTTTTFDAATMAAGNITTISTGLTAINANLTSSTGNIDLRSTGGNISQANSTTIQATEGGVRLRADSGNVTVGDVNSGGANQLNPAITADNNSTPFAAAIQILAYGTATVAGVDATGTGANVEVVSDSASIQLHDVDATGSVFLQAIAGAIVDANGDLNNITAANASLRAANGIGNGGYLETDVNVLVAYNSTSGNIEVRNVDTDVSAIDGLLSIGTVGTLAGVTNAGPTLGDGTIWITNVGPVTMNSGIGNSAAGDITVAAEGSGPEDDLTINANVTAAGGNGNIYLYAGDTIEIQGSPNARTVSAAGSGAIRVWASTNYSNGTGLSNGYNGGGSEADTAGRVVMGSGSIIRSEDGNIDIRGDGDILLSVVDANSDHDTSRGRVTVWADWNGVAGGMSDNAGAIVDNHGAATNVIGSSAALRAATGIGSSNAIETSVSILAAVNSTSGIIDIANLVGSLLTIGAVDGLSGVVNQAEGAALSVSNQGALTVADSVAASAADVSADGKVTLTTVDANGRADHLTVKSGVTVESTHGAVELRAGDDLTL
ncbi:MAG: autotransporter-associated beta strand repeat-containing protein, partial [Pirellulaceae bacterium]|nr:autotransporter-associated beta strand repeat-containing protein [Pirellulaceae bacterium]